MLGKQSVAPQLVELLDNEQVDWRVRRSIADALGVLGEGAAVPQLLGLLASKQVDQYVRMRIALALATMIDKEEDVQFLANLLIDSNKDIANSIYSALWSASRRVCVRVLVRNEAGKERLQVVRR